jgi:hypothetical protein
MQHLGDLINGVYRLLNAQRSQRWTIVEDIIPALNTATRQYIQDLYDDVKKSNRPYSFESFQRIKSSLRTIVERRKPLVLVKNIATLPDDYWYDIGLLVKLTNLIEQPSTSLTFNEEKPAIINFLDRPSETDIRHMEYRNNIEIKYGGGLNGVQAAYLDYIRQPKYLTAVPFVSGSLLLAGQKYWIEEGTLNDGTTTFTEGSVFNAVASVVATSTDSVYAISDIEMPVNTLDEIAAIAARYLTGNSGDYERKNNADYEATKA